MTPHLKDWLARMCLVLPPRKAGTGTAQILMYHKIAPSLEGQPNRWIHIDSASFDNQLAFLKRSGYHFLTIDELISALNTQKAFPPRTALLTFDDGSADNYRHAFPLLKKHGVPAIIFLTAGYVGTDRVFWWDRAEWWLKVTKKETATLEYQGKRIDLTLRKPWEKVWAWARIDRLVKENLADLDNILSILKDALGITWEGPERSCLNWEEVKTMAREGISFGAHTVEHARLSELSAGQALAELKGSKEIIEKKLGREVPAFAYPFGGPQDFSGQNAALLKKAGFKAAFTTISSVCRVDDDPLQIGRIAVSGMENFPVFMAKLTTYYPEMFNLARNLIGKT